MPVTITDRTTAGNAYTSALTTLLNAYIELAATERALVRQGIDPPGGRFGAELGDLADDLFLLRHPVYALTPNQPRLGDRVTTRAAQL
jgi:hypothetical protein